MRFIVGKSDWEEILRHLTEAVTALIKKFRTTKGRAELFGAGDRTRTGTLSPAVDFESTTSTNSITPA